MVDDPLQPSPEAETILRTVGWSPERAVDASEWIDTLRNEGNEVFPHAEVILRNFGSLRLEHPGYGGLSNQDIEIDPILWYGERDRIRDIEDIIGHKICPLGITSGVGMLAILEDGSVIGEFEGDVLLFGRNWSEALDNLILGRGTDVKLAEDYEPVQPD